MKLSRITKTRQGRYALFDDADAFLFSVDEETLVRRHLAEGMVLDAPELASLRDESDLQKAKEKALVYLGMRAYAEKELYDKLCLKFDPHTSAAAVAQMQRMGLLDDAQFAANRVRALAQKKKSTREIRMHLLQKGIDKEAVDEALAAQEPDDAEACYALLQKSYLRKLEAGETQKVIAAMARRGFSYSVVKDAIARCGQDADNLYEEDYE